MKIKVTKLTDVDLLRKCASFTSGKECGMSLMTAYRNKHSIIRSQLFFVEMTDIPLFCASQFVRSTQGVNWYQRTKRTDRGGKDFFKVCDDIASEIKSQEELVERGEYFLGLSDMSDKVKTLPSRFGRYAPTDLCGIMNAEAIMNMSGKRLCSMASKETHGIWEQVLREVEKTDPDLVKFCVKPCISHGGICRESKCCGFNRSERGKELINNFKQLFK